jgi:uncharacterized protein (DUF983 family)
MPSRQPAGCRRYSKTCTDGARGPAGKRIHCLRHRPMPTRKTSSTLASMLGQRCPRCREGRIFHYSIFRGFPKMCERCSVCDLKFQREEGYFLGAMYISFGLALVIIALIAGLLWAITGWWITRVTIWAVVLFLPLAPAISLLARVLWIYLDQAFDPEKT